MKIIVTVNASWNVINFRKPLIDAFLARGADICVAAPRDSYSERIKEIGCDFHELKMKPESLSLAEVPGLIWQMFTIMKRQKPAVVFGFTIKNNIFGALAARFLNIPFFPNVTGLGTAFLGSNLLRSVAVFLYRLAFQKCPGVFFQNRDDARLFLEEKIVREEQVIMLPGSGINLESFYYQAPILKNALHFLMIARVVKDKGIVEFVEAARLVKADHPEVQFSVVGDIVAENRGAIDHAQLKSWQDEGIVEFCGKTDDIKPHIVQADCVVLPSYREGMPRVLLEAGAVGRPVIATDVPGCRDAVDVGESGYLCQLKDADDLAEKMRMMIALEDEERLKMGQAGRRKMECEFDEAIVVQNYLDALDRVA